MRSIIAGFTTLLALAASTKAEPEKRASLPRPFKVVQDLKTLGTVAFAGSNPFVAVVSQGPGTPLYVDNGTLYGVFLGAPPTHAYLDFPFNATGCATVGDLIFSYTNSNKCSISGPFEVNHNEIIYNPTGSFIVCDSTKNTIRYVKDFNTPKGCQRVQLVGA